MIAKLLGNMNPWWKDEKWETKDKSLVDYYRQPIRWSPEWTKKISLQPFSLNFVLGMRQVGKTTGIKLLIQQLVRENAGERVAYIDCEVLPDFTGLHEAIEFYLDATKKEDTRFIFLDEVTALPGWWRPVKYLIDQGKLENAVVTVTGSSTLKVRRDVELFPGRTGNGKIVEVFPVSFDKYVKIHGIKNYNLEYDRVLALFHQYLGTGGFPLTINGFSPAHVLNSVIGEIVRFGKSLEIARETFASVISKMPSAMSYRSIASETSGYSYKTIQEYLEFFRDLYLIEYAYFKSKNGKVEFRREKKIFFRDPLLLSLFSAWTNTQYRHSALIENIVQEHLFRKYGEIYYTRNSHEIDCIAGNIRVEIKTERAHRRYPREVIILSEEEIPRFLIELSTRSHPE